MEPITDHNKYRILEDIITPLARIPYEKQLKMKEELVKTHAQILTEMKPKRSNILPISPSVRLILYFIFAHTDYALQINQWFF